MDKHGLNPPLREGAGTYSSILGVFLGCFRESLLGPFGVVPGVILRSLRGCPGFVLGVIRLFLGIWFSIVVLQLYIGSEWFPDSSIRFLGLECLGFLYSILGYIEKGRVLFLYRREGKNMFNGDKILKVGDEVEYTSRRDGNVYDGIIVRVYDHGASYLIKYVAHQDGYLSSVSCIVFPSEVSKV